LLSFILITIIFYIGFDRVGIYHVIFLTGLGLGSLS
jgi:hypothetical protein